MKQKLKNSTGITLVALVVTIVVLLILAGITIIYAIGENSIFKKTQDTKDKTDQAIKDEQEYFNNLDNTINQYLNGNGGEGSPNDRVEISTITEKVDKNTLAKDSLENPITIPEGFKVVPDGQDGAEYTYTGDKKPTVQDGIVIEDEEGNQFVWIPVGSIKNKDGSSTTIQLARYTFDITLNSDYTISGGTGAIKQTITDGSSLTDAWTELHADGYEYLEEASTSTTYGNAKAKDVEDFKTKAKSNGGYYLARYEASKGEDDKVKSKSAVVWNSITQLNAAMKAREMYTSTSFESDLVNSYAWDTAIVFIQEYSGDSDYSKEVGPTFGSDLKNTGTTADKRCNIYDMASNVFEWTTETYTNKEYPCIRRGGVYNNERGACTAYRIVDSKTHSLDFISFRPLLYVK
ncbi:MAG: type II secretion system protein [Clostridia bacterium]|nr:type II secretion system protein [Clostridia bacterium]